MKQKKIISLLLSVVLAFTACFSYGVVALADDVTYSYDSESATLTISGSGEISSYTENTLKDRPWYTYADSTEKVVISEGITKIGDYAFSRFSSLTSVTIPSSVESIGSTAFGGNDSLKEITIPDTVTEIGDFAFGYNYAMEIPSDFVCHCGVKSAAQKYCLQKYVPFDTPMTGYSATAHITSQAELELWSFVPQTNGTLTFYSTGTKDTVGSVYDASDYAYSSSYSEMKKSAIGKGDDELGINFKITITVEKGKRYYLAARFMRSERYDGGESGEDGQFGVVMTYVCTEHEYEVVSETPATCSADGMRYEKCIGCGATLEEVLPKLDHTPGEAVEENRVEPTCTTDGSYDSVVYCTVCTAEISRETITLDSLGHDLGEYVSNGDATCTQDGTKSAKCSRCDYVKTVADEGSAPGHNYVDEVVAPTCTEQGYTKHTCSRCEDTYNDTYVDALEHISGDVVKENEVAPTCTTDGSYDDVVYCTRCNAELSRTPQTVSALGHLFEITAFDGEIVSCKCSRCESTKDFDFMLGYNKYIKDQPTDEQLDKEWSVLDANDDGIINAKDFIMITKSLSNK